MPYTSKLAFDKDGRFDTIFETITSFGSYKEYMDFVLSVRAAGRIEARLAIASSLASVLIKPCGLNPFWVNLWGRSGGGKSVCGMLAASVYSSSAFSLTPYDLRPVRCVPGLLHLPESSCLSE